MRIAVISALMLSALTGCIKNADNSNLQIADNQAATVENCFSSLVAGKKTSSGKLESVSFAHGICQGTSKALDKLSEQSSVTVVKDNQAYKSSLYIQGNDVIATLEGLNIKVGNVNKNPDDAELVLLPSTKVELSIVQDSGNAETWKPGSSTKGKEEIRLIVN